jgi:hypothetical protein
MGAHAFNCVQAGVSPLMCAYRNQNAALATMLLEKGAVVIRPPVTFSCIKVACVPASFLLRIVLLTLGTTPRSSLSSQMSSSASKLLSATEVLLYCTPHCNSTSNEKQSAEIDFSKSPTKHSVLKTNASTGSS